MEINEKKCIASDKKCEKAVVNKKVVEEKDLDNVAGGVSNGCMMIRKWELLLMTENNYKQYKGLF